MLFIFGFSCRVDTVKIFYHNIEGKQMKKKNKRNEEEGEERDPKDEEEENGDNVHTQSIVQRIINWLLSMYVYIRENVFKNKCYIQ